MGWLEATISTVMQSLSDKVNSCPLIQMSFVIRILVNFGGQNCSNFGKGFQKTSKLAKSTYITIIDQEEARK